MKKFTLLILLFACAIGYSQSFSEISAEEITSLASKKSAAVNLSSQAVSGSSATSATSQPISAELVVGIGSNAQIANPVERRASMAYRNVLVSSNQLFQKTAVINTTANSLDQGNGSSPTIGSQNITYTATDFNGYSYNNSNNSSMLPVLAYTSGPYFNVAGPPDVSLLEDTALGMGTYGSGAQANLGNRVADDIILADDYDITSFVFYAYQTGAPTAPASIQEISVQVWDGDPNGGGATVIWGDDVTNVLSSKVWSDAYRQLESNPGQTNRAIQEITVDVTGLSLTAGTYWVDWGYVGDPGFSGPWQPPVAILGQSATGNAQQSLAGVWAPLVDVGAQGLPIDVYGDVVGGGGGPCASPMLEINQDVNDTCMANQSQTDLAQSYIPLEPNATGAGFEFTAASTGENLDLSLWDGLPNAGGTMLASGTTVTTGDVWVDVFWDPVAVTVGNTYYIVMEGTVSQCYAGSTNNPYPDGNVFANAGYQPFPTFDYTFRTYSCDGGGGGGCTTGVFTDRAAFEAAFMGTLNLEDFAGGPGVITTCSGPINNAGNDCFAPGEILPGIEITNLDPNLFPVVIPAGALGNVDPLVGPNTFADVFVMNFPDNDVNSFGGDVYLPLVAGATDVDVRIYGVGGLIETQVISVSAAGPTFFGYIGAEIIVSVQMEDSAGAGEGELIGMVAFGECSGGGGGPVCSEENPTNNFENGFTSSSSTPQIIGADLTVPVDTDMILNSVMANWIVFDGEIIVSADIVVYNDLGGLPDPASIVSTQLGVVPTSQAIISDFPANGALDVLGLVFDLAPVAVDGQVGVSTTYWISVYVTNTSGNDSFWEFSSTGEVGFGNVFSPDAGVTWGVALPGSDQIYTFSGECTPIIVIPDPTYDTCDAARPIACGEIAAGSTIGATVDSAVAPTCDTTVTAPGVWYIYEDTTGLITDITITMCNGTTDYDAKLSVYTGDCNAPPLTCVVGNDDTCGLQSEVSFQSDGATTFYILVHGFGSAVGNFEIEMTCTPVPPPNDMIANSIDVDQIGFPYTDPSVAMPAATTEAGTPAGCDNAGAKGVWYNFVAPGDGDATASITSPAGFSSVTFYTAPNENAVETDLVLVDWFENQCLPGIEASIPTVSGQAYYVYVVNHGGITDIVIDAEFLGVAGNTIEGFSYYPNPTENTLNLSSVENIENVAIYNMLGQKMMDINVNATTSEINVSRLTTGAYLMQVSVNGQMGTYKILKK